MPQAPISFVNAQSSGLDELGGASPVAVNVCVDGAGTVFRRPGIATYLAAQQPNAVSGMVVSNGDRVFALYDTLAERAIYDVSSPVTPVRLATAAGAASGLAGSGRPAFAETEMIIAIAGGSDMQKIVLAPFETTDRLGGSPPFATHVVANGSRLLANDLQATSSRTIVRYSGIAQGTVTYSGLEQWSVGIGNAGFFTAEADPDPIVAIYANSNEVFTFGTRSLQVFGSDPNLVFGTVAARELGCGAGYSVIPVDQQFLWLDNKRRFVISDGREYNVISDPIKRTLDGMSRVDDCFGYRVLMGPVDALLWTFPSDGRTFAFQKGGGWAEWLGWTGTNWTQFPVTSCAYRPATAQHLVGLGTGDIATLSLTNTTDLAGSAVRAFIQTGYMSRDTDARKECIAVRIALRRGQTQSAVGPQAFFWWADRPGDVMDKIPIDLGKSGDSEIVLEFCGLGVYRRRQWFFEFAGSEQLTLVGATETYNVLEY